MRLFLACSLARQSRGQFSASNIHRCFSSSRVMPISRSWVTGSGFSVASIRSRSRPMAASSASTSSWTTSVSRSQPSFGPGSVNAEAIVSGLLVRRQTERRGPLGDRVGVAAGRRHHLVELKMDRTEPRADDVPVRLLPDQ